MRIAHLTDLHYSSLSSVYDFENLFEALMKSLKAEHTEKKIDLVFITGDLVDRGGINVKSSNHYVTVQQMILDHIASSLYLTNDRIIILPGNHDVCEEKDNDDFYLKGLRSDINIPAINKLVDDNLSAWRKKEIGGLTTFKDFENSFYSKSVDPATEIYRSNFETCFIFTFEKAKIGIAAFNSSWSCASALDKDSKYKLAFGTGQIARARKKFDNVTDFNIALLHHPINKGFFSDKEEQEMKRAFSKGNFSMLFCGHTHEAQDNFIKEPNFGYYLIVTKASLNNPRVDTEIYKSGFSLIDLSYCSEEELTVTRHFRKYVKNSGSFDFDVDEALRGTSSLKLTPNYIGKNFINYLKGFSKLFDPERKALFDTINSVAQNYIKSPFSELIGKGLQKSFDRFLPKNSEFNYIRKDLSINWEIKYLDDNNYYFNEQQAFTINSTKDPFEFLHGVYVDKILDGIDKTSIAFTQFLVDDIDYQTEFKQKNQPLPKEGVYGKERVTHILRKRLEGKETYEVKSKFEAINSLTSRKAWKITRRNVVDGYKIKILDLEDRYYIELYGVGEELYFSNVDKFGRKVKEIFVDHHDQIFAPGNEFWLFVSNYIPLPS